MKPFRRLPLAWLQLIDHKGRLLTSIAGIAFAVVLMFLQLGFRNGFYDSQLQLVRGFNATLVILNKAKNGMNVTEPFPRQRVFQARGAPGVEAVYALYVEMEHPIWKNSRDRSSRPIRVLAFDPDEPVLLFPDVRRQAELLKLPDTVLLDEQSKALYGRRAAGVETELSRRALRVGGTFRLGTDFISDGNVIMSDKNYLKFLQDRRDPEAVRHKVELGLVRVAAGADPLEVQERLRGMLSDDVLVLTKDEFLERERAYWRNNTPLDFVFGLGAMLGFVVGVIICYQILFTDVLDHLPQFAMLKAIGYPNRYVLRVVLGQAVLLALLGFGPGLLLSRGLYELVAILTGLPMRLTVDRAVLILILTIVMCTVAGLISVRKALSADPAEVF
jgi:putative ABC transport system permease protein